MSVYSKSLLGWQSRTVAWLVTLVMPFQVLTGVYLDTRGPAHFHVGHDDDHHDRGHVHSHGQGQVEHHHHHPHDSSVVTIHDDSLPSHLALEEETPSGWSGSMLVALVTSGASPQPPEMRDSVTPKREPLLRTRFPGRLERPPRIDPA
jgi:hypothetical protein